MSRIKLGCVSCVYVQKVTTQSNVQYFCQCPLPKVPDWFKCILNSVYPGKGKKCPFYRKSRCKVEGESKEIIESIEEENADPKV